MKAMFDDFDNIDDDLMEDLGNDLPLSNEDVLGLDFEPNDLTCTIYSDVMMGELDMSGFQLGCDDLQGGLSTFSSNNDENAELGSDDHVMELMDDELLGNEQRGEVSFLGHSQSEINRYKTKAESDMRDAESDMRHFKKIAESKARMGEPHGYENYQYSQAQHRYETAKDELNKWRHMRADD